MGNWSLPLEAVSITVKLGVSGQERRVSERVVTNVAVAYGQRGAYAEEFTQTLCSVVHGHTGFSDGGTLNNEARALVSSVAGTRFAGSWYGVWRGSGFSLYQDAESVGFLCFICDTPFQILFKEL